MPADEVSTDAVLQGNEVIGREQPRSYEVISSGSFLNEIQNTVLLDRDDKVVARLFFWHTHPSSGN